MILKQNQVCYPLIEWHKPPTSTTPVDLVFKYFSIDLKQWKVKGERMKTKGRKKPTYCIPIFPTIYFFKIVYPKSKTGVAETLFRV